MDCAPVHTPRSIHTALVSGLSRHLRQGRRTLTALGLALGLPLAAQTVATPPLSPAGQAPASAATETRLLVVPRHSGEAHARRESRLAAAEERLGFRPRRVFRHAGHVREILVPAGQSADAAIARLRATGDYESVEPDRPIYETATPNDPRFADGTLWALHNTGQNSGTADADIDAPEAWDVRTAGVLVAVMDSGALLTHEDLAANLWQNPTPGAFGYSGDKYGIDSIANTGLGDSSAANDGRGHGTHVSGTIAAVGHNGIGIVGVAWNAKLMILRFLNDNGKGSTSDAIECINYAVKAGARIINASFGSDSSSSAELAALRAARDAGIVFVAAAGNDASNHDLGNAYPASYALDNIVAVAASTRLDDIASFSDFGSGSVELAAPGENIYSTTNTGNSSYTANSGTSMAAPHVSGALALMAAHYPGDNYRQLINRLLRSVDRKPSFLGKVHTGGRLNLAAALANPSSRPFNDDFGNRPLLVGSYVRARSASQFGTREPGEPSHAGQTGGASLWWKWTAPTTGQIRIETVGSAIDTVLAVYTGSDLAALTPVAGDDNSGGANGASRLSFTAVANTTYQIAVDGKNGATGLVLLNMGLVPANDNFATPSDQAGVSWAVSATNAAATREAGEPNHANRSGAHSLWYRWTAPTTRSYAAAVYSKGFDPVVAIYVGTSLGALSPIASNDDSNGLPSSVAPFSASAGQTYWIAVDGAAESETGEFTLTVVDSDWQFATSASITSSPAIAPDGSVVVGSFDGSLLALRADGTTKWKLSTAPIDIASPAIDAEGTAYCGDNKGVLRAVTSAGTVKWQFSAGGAIPSSPALGADGSVYFRAEDQFLYALNAAGVQQWRFATGGVSYSSPAIAPDGTIYVGADNNTLVAVNPNGTSKWVFSTTGGVYTSPALAADGTVFAGTLAGRVYAVTPAGTERWHFDASGSVSSSPVLGVDGTVYFGDYSGGVYALNGATGALRWKYSTGSEFRACTPAIGADGTVYIGAYDHKLYAIASGGTLLRTYAMAGIVRSSPVLAGGRLFVGCNDGKLYALPVPTGLAASEWPTFRQNPRRTGRIMGSGPPPVIVLQPSSTSADTGATVVLSVMVEDPSTASFQWYKNGIALPGGIGSSLRLVGVSAGSTGLYTVRVRNASGEAVVSTPASLNVRPQAYTPPSSVLINISTRAMVGTGSNIMIAGFVIGGSGSKRVLVRAVGPGLAGFGVSGTLANPTLTLTTLSGTTLATNDDWGSADPSGIAAASAAAGAFPLQAGSSDSALIVTLPSGPFTALISGVGNATGIALVEVYDLDNTAAARLINLSTRAQAGSGASALIAGFVIIGSTPKPVLIRAIGPTLGTFGVGSVVPDPILALTTSSGTPIANNDNWYVPNGPAIATAASQVGAFPLDTAARDSALLIALPAGQYTPAITDRNGNPGVALVEVYEAP